MLLFQKCKIKEGYVDGMMLDPKMVKNVSGVPETERLLMLSEVYKIVRNHEKLFSIYDPNEYSYQEIQQDPNKSLMENTKNLFKFLKKHDKQLAKLTETGNKYYPFNGEYLVASRTAVVSPTKMNILYYGLEQIGGNPVQVSVPGYPAGEIKPRMTNGKIKPVKKSEGMYVCMPNKNAREAVITLYANVDGKQKSMGKVEFRVKKTPPPTPLIGSVKKGLISKNVLKEEIVRAELKDFLFDGLRYAVTSFKMTGYINGAPATAVQKNGMGFTKEQKRIIANAAKGSDITITQIYAKLTPGKSDPVPLPTALVFKLK